MSTENNTRIELKAVLRTVDLSTLESWIVSETDLYVLFPSRINNNIYFEIRPGLPAT